MLSLHEIHKSIQNKKKHFKDDFQVKRLGIFGSFARQEQTATSDVDVLVEFNHTIGLFKFAKLQNELSNLLGRKVDLATPNSLKPLIKDVILGEVNWIAEP